MDRSLLATVVCVPLTSNLQWADASGNVRLSARITNLDDDSVAKTLHIIALDSVLLIQRVGRLSRAKMCGLASTSSSAGSRIL